MSLIVISDLHLSPKTAERNSLFLKFLENALQNADEVLIAGDLFDLWFGWNHLTFDYQRPILSRMEELVSRGLIMNYVEGNRDFGIARYGGDLFHEVSTGFLEMDWRGRRIHVEHGDLINKDDKPYRTWRAISKNRLSYWMLKSLPSPFLSRFTGGLERQLKRTNQKHKTHFPEKQCESFYRNHFQKGIEIVITGHFHCEKEVEVKWKDRNVLFYSLPGWENGFRYLVIPGGREKPYFQELGR